MKGGLAIGTALGICIVSIVIAVTYYNVKRDEAMKSNIESAIVKGIDPIAVKCAYGHADTVCALYVSNKK